MALGIVNSIDDPANPISGTIKEDESEQIYPFRDSNFPSTGLGQGSPCTYDIDYSVDQPIATNLQSYTPTLVEVSTAVTQDYTVRTGETLKIKRGGVVTGSVNVNNGNLFVEDQGSVLGNITVDLQGSFIVRKGGTVTGSIMISNGSAMKVVNKGKITGSVTIMKANRLIMGNANDGGILYGSLTIQKVRRVIITDTTKFNC
ncbi:MAG: hypothetical protein IPJ32_11825 [Sphingobacteriaceae bacterium]|nr:hypothetical protein [Sphingobacteriaceae bacterium]